MTEKHNLEGYVIHIFETMQKGLNTSKVSEREHLALERMYVSNMRTAHKLGYDVFSYQRWFENYMRERH